MVGETWKIWGSGSAGTGSSNPPPPPCPAIIITIVVVSLPGLDLSSAHSKVWNWVYTRKPVTIQYSTAAGSACGYHVITNGGGSQLRMCDLTFTIASSVKLNYYYLGLTEQEKCLRFGQWMADIILLDVCCCVVSINSSAPGQNHRHLLLYWPKAAAASSSSSLPQMTMILKGQKNYM